MTPQVSVIVPVYNHAAFLEECVRSALVQEKVDLEVIIVDDCSTDDSRAVAERLTQDTRVRLVTNERNLGAYATQNKAMDHANGEFIAVLNSDDLWLPNKLRPQLDLLAANYDAGFCYTLGLKVGTDARPIEEDIHDGWPVDMRQDLLPFLLANNRILASSVVFRRRGVRFEESVRFSGDWLALLRLSESSDALCVPERLTLWRQHPTNSYLRSQTLTLEEIRVRRAILRERKKWLALRKDNGRIRRALSECAIHLTALYVLVGQMRMAKAAASLALRLSPANSAAHRRLAVALMPAVVARRRLWGGETVRIDKSALKSLAPLSI